LVSKFQQTTNKTHQNKFQKFLQLVKKNADFQAECKYDKLTAKNFSPKVTSKRRGKNQAFMLLIKRGYFLWRLNLFGETFLQCLQKFCTSYKILHD